MTELCVLAKKYLTDKGPQGHNYTPYYSMFFEKEKYASLKILEIGIDEGSSLRAWKDYFRNSEIHGIDIRGNYEYLNDEGIITHIVDHSNKGDLIVFGEQYPEYFDIIIEDGSHMSEDSILTFETLFPYLKSGGYFCVEDLLCDYDSRWNKGRSSIEYFKGSISNVNMNGNIPNSHICANKQEAVKKYPGSYLDLNIEWIFNSCGLVIIKKL